MKLIARFDDPHVQLKGWIPPDKIPQYLATIHIGLLPVVSDSKFNKAKSSTKLFEYMAMAKPTVSSGIGEANEIIQDGVNGLLAMTKVEFAKKMQVLIKDPLLRTRLGDSARQSIEMKYSLKVLGRQLYDILKPNLC
jgi:glycosyltransferase involved in cell wall biosynthesis